MNNSENYNHDENFHKTVDYNSVKTLERFSEVLNEVSKYYGSNSALVSFKSKNGRPLGFFVYDLVDTTNNSMNGIVNFKEGHVYHFASSYLYYSVSNICILKEGKLIFFKALNCKRKIDDVKDVVNYLKPYLSNNLTSQKLLVRILNYRKFGRYLKVDYPICRCEN